MPTEILYHYEVRSTRPKEGLGYIYAFSHERKKIPSAWEISGEPDNADGNVSI